jgi:hypothetical protein
MQLCIRHRDRAAAVAHYRRVEGTLGRELEFLPGQAICLLFVMAMRGGYNFRELTIILSSPYWLTGE